MWLINIHEMNGPIRLGFTRKPSCKSLPKTDELCIIQYYMALEAHFSDELKSWPSRLVDRLSDFRALASGAWVRALALTHDKPPLCPNVVVRRFPGTFFGTIPESFSDSSGSVGDLLWMC